MNLKQFIHLTFIFLILVCLSHSANAISDYTKKWHRAPVSAACTSIAQVFHR